MRILAIDQGTSSTKALVLDDGVVVCEAEVPVHPRAGTDGAVTQDAEELWQSVLTSGHTALRSAGGSIPDAIGIANQGETVLAWHPATLEPIGPARSWQDRRSGGICDELRQHGERLAAITGLSLDPYFSAPKMRWVRDQVGPRPTVGTSDAWLVQKLCGAYVTDAATASRSLLLDLDTVEWSPEACDIFAVDIASLPTIVDNDAIVGMTTAFGGAVPVAGLCVDQQAALWAQGCTNAGDAKCTYGTGAFLLASTGRAPVRSVNGLVGCVAWRLHGEPSWCLDGQVYSVGSAVSWLERLGVIESPTDLDRTGGSVTSSDGVVFVPALAGLGAPFWAPTARGLLSGLSLSTERAHVVHAVVDGIAAQVAWLCRAVASDLGASLTALRVDGGLTRSRLLLQLQADLAQIPVEVHHSPHATALGVGALAARAIGGPSGAAGVTEPAMVIEPSISADEAEERLARWRLAAEAAAVMSTGRSMPTPGQ